MDRIIQYTEEFLIVISEKILNGITDVDELSADVLSDCKKLAREIVQEIITQLNETMRQDKKTRKDLGLVMKEKNRPRKILTELGELEFNRDYYYNSLDEKYETPLDKMIGIQPRERVGDSVSAKLVNLATEMSYAKSAALATDGLVSRQTVKNQINRVPILEKKTEESGRIAKVLDVYADEDHVHMQKPNKKRGKKNQMVPLVTVSEGIEFVNARRGKTVRPMHFVNEKFDSDELWTSVEGYIEKTYDMDSIEAIRIHADGGKWIQNGLENFPNVEHVMDGYHLQKRLKQLDNRFKGHLIKRSIEWAINEGNYYKAEVALGNLYSKCKSEADANAISEMTTYLGSHWEAITNRYKDGVTGSCTEGQVSHLLSERFSRNPMGWSKTGLGKLSTLRIYKKNGGIICNKHFKADYEIKESYSKYAEKLVQKSKRRYDFSWMTELKENYIIDTASATQYRLREMTEMHWRLN